MNMKSLYLRVAGFVLLLSITQHAHAADLVVTRTDDPIPDGCLATDCSLREAVILANAVFGADTIDLGANIYQLSIDGAGEDLSVTGDLDVLDDLSIFGAGESQTSIVMNAQHDRVIQLVVDPASGVRHRLDLSNLTTSGGFVHSEDELSTDGKGGCIRASGEVHFENVMIGNCQADQDGGLSLNFVGATSLVNVTIANSNAERHAAGAGIISYADPLIVHGLTIRDTQLTGYSSKHPNSAGGLSLYTRGTGAQIDNVVLKGNSAQECAGGEISIDDHVTLSAFTISDNHAFGNGGGLCLGQTLNDIYAELRDFTVSDNTANGNGGGIYIRPDPNHPIIYALTFRNADIGNNIAGDDSKPGNGGGIAFPFCPGCDPAYPQVLDIYDSNIHDNTARAHTTTVVEGGLGGGIYSELPLYIKGSMLSGNRADRYGGALAVDMSATGLKWTTNVITSTLSANRTMATSGATGGGAVYARETQMGFYLDTFVDNRAFGGGVLYNTGAQINFSQCTLVKSVSNPPGAVGSLIGAYTNANRSTLTEIENSLLAGTCNGVMPSAPSGNIEAGNGFTNSCNMSGTSVANVALGSLQLGPLADNGGPTLTQMPGPGSVMRGAAYANDCSSIDQRGYTRTHPAICDVGSVQVSAVNDILFRNGFETN